MQKLWVIVLCSANFFNLSYGSGQLWYWNLSAKLWGQTKLKYLLSSSAILQLPHGAKYSMKHNLYNSDCMLSKLGASLSIVKSNVPILCGLNTWRSASRLQFLHSSRVLLTMTDGLNIWKKSTPWLFCPIPVKIAWNSNSVACWRSRVRLISCSPNSLFEGVQWINEYKIREMKL